MQPSSQTWFSKNSEILLLKIATVLFTWALGLQRQPIYNRSEWLPDRLILVSWPPPPTHIHFMVWFLGQGCGNIIVQNGCIMRSVFQNILACLFLSSSIGIWGRFEILNWVWHWLCAWWKRSLLRPACYGKRCLLIHQQQQSHAVSAVSMSASQYLRDLMNNREELVYNFQWDNANSRVTLYKKKTLRHQWK